MSQQYRQRHGLTAVRVCRSNSNRDYNVIFRDESGNATDAQPLAFEDTWHWGTSA
jgi:hypothetical protein